MESFCVSLESMSESQDIWEQEEILESCLYLDPSRIRSKTDSICKEAQGFMNTNCKQIHLQEHEIHRLIAQFCEVLNTGSPAPKQGIMALLPTSPGPKPVTPDLLLIAALREAGLELLRCQTLEEFLELIQKLPHLQSQSSEKYSINPDYLSMNGGLSVVKFVPRAARSSLVTYVKEGHVKRVHEKRPWLLRIQLLHINRGRRDAGRAHQVMLAKPCTGAQVLWQEEPRDDQRELLNPTVWPPKSGSSFQEKALVGTLSLPSTPLLVPQGTDRYDINSDIRNNTAEAALCVDSQIQRTPISTTKGLQPFCRLLCKHGTEMSSRSMLPAARPASSLLGMRKQSCQLSSSALSLLTDAQTAQLPCGQPHQPCCSSKQSYSLISSSRRGLGKPGAAYSPANFSYNADLKAEVPRVPYPIPFPHEALFKTSHAKIRCGPEDYIPPQGSQCREATLTSEQEGNRSAPVVLAPRRSSATDALQTQSRQRHSKPAAPCAQEGAACPARDSATPSSVSPSSHQTSLLLCNVFNRQLEQGPQSFQAETFPGAAQTAMLPDMHAAGPSVPGELCSQTKTHLMSLNACCKGTPRVVTLNLQN
ncbi:hypothetical protein Anapl_08094 [Anas platyrhynchos]|uniref:Uncharacterized protein n=1 Tax=Anas platyrhynchos TaxID=8839 RepID=R0K3F4_ANAPL|nr:hypothetical protein Anapl_08094 [Anas platyrhynchos]